MSILPTIFAGHVPDWLQQQARSPDVEAIVQKWAREHDAEMQDNANKMKAFLESLPAPLSSAEIVVTEGEPTAAILTASNSGRHELVVIGTRRKWSTGSAILGRVSEAVLNHAECSGVGSASSRGTLRQMGKWSEKIYEMTATCLARA